MPKPYERDAMMDWVWAASDAAIVREFTDIMNTRELNGEIFKARVQQIAPRLQYVLREGLMTRSIDERENFLAHHTSLR